MLLHCHKSLNETLHTLYSAYSRVLPVLPKVATTIYVPYILTCLSPKPMLGFKIQKIELYTFLKLFIFPQFSYGYRFPIHLKSHTAQSPLAS
jgi:hypothetical protein